VGDPAGSNATAGLALRATGTHKPLHHDKVKIPSEISLEKKVLRLGTLVPMNIEVPTKYLLSQDRIVVLEKYISPAKALCSADQRSMATEML
jgi:hypothetical protein